MSRAVKPTRAGAMLGVSIAWSVIAIGFAGAPAPTAQPEHARLDDPDRVIEGYLDRLGLGEALAVQLRSRLDRARPDERSKLASRLASIYAEQLESARTSAQRQRVERLARELIESVPDSETIGLRITLEKARYLEAERIAERHRLGLAEREKIDEAVRILSQTRSAFVQIGTSSHRRVARLEELERRGDNPNERLIEDELEIARRHRSLAMYYAGWSSYYLGLLTGSAQPATESLASFAWLLNAPGEQMPDASKVPGSTLRFDHVARAALGVAMGHSLRGAHAQALQWLELVDSSDQVPASVREEMFARKLIVYTAARRWADIEWMVHRAEASSQASDPPMGVLDARLLVVLTLEALEGRDAGRASAEVESLAEALVQTGLASLVRRGEVGHVLELMETYGTTPIGEEGFIVEYVTGLEAYERARESHREATQGEPSTPTDSTPVASQYRLAGAHFRSALQAEDASSFPAERTACRIQLGLSLYYADDPRRAVEALQTAWAQAPDDATRERALWLAIVAAERWTRVGDPGDDPESTLERLSSIYIASHPRTERAARLVLRQDPGVLGDPSKAAEVLAGVPRGSPLYHAARGRAADLAYRAFRAAPERDRAFAAMRFVELAREVGELMRSRIAAGDAQADASSSLVTLYRQMLDAVLALDPPDVRAAERTITRLDGLDSEPGVDLDPIRGEIAYRRVQIALASGERDQIARAMEDLRSIGGGYLRAAGVLLYRDAYDRWSREPDDPALASRVVETGSELVGRRLSEDPDAADDPAVRTLMVRVARAGRLLWDSSQDRDGRDAAIKMDAALIDAGVRTEEVLVRHAELSEQADDTLGSLDSWRILLAAAEERSEFWYRARYHSLRLLIETDPEQGKKVLEQFRVLHPELGPEPWRSRFSELDASLGGSRGGGP